MIEVMFLLLAAHYLADFPLQGEFIAMSKGKVFRESIGFHTLTAHAVIQGAMAAGAVALLGHPWVWPFVVVAVTHWVIDFGKAWEGFRRPPYGINVDQGLHVAVLVIVALGLEVL